MNIRLSILLVIFVFSVFSNISHASEQQPQGRAIDQVTLPKELRDVLVSEMRSIQEGMESLVSAIASGDWHDVSQIAHKLRDSYIMKQKLTERQLEELHHSLPPGFQELDQSFHHLAGMLSHVAEHGHDELVTFYFYKLADSCVACHSKYATHRFPGFAKSKEGEGHHHK
jgi:hypothetical protein